MRIVLLVGSYRRNGNTARIVELIKEGLCEVAGCHDETLEIETINLVERDIRPCRGCRVCFDRGEERCPLRDDLLAIKTKMEWADGIVLASPVYVNDVSGSVKNWIDRLAFVCHRPEFAGKCAYLVATVADSPTKHTLGTMSMALRTWGVYIVGQTGFKMGALMKEEELQVRYGEKTRKIARQLFYAIQKRRFTKPTFFSLMVFKIQQRAWQRTRDDSIDYRYWRNQGWTEPHREFYIHTEANRLKVALARLSGALIGRIVT